MAAAYFSTGYDCNLISIGICFLEVQEIVFKVRAPPIHVNAVFFYVIRNQHYLQDAEKTISNEIRKRNGESFYPHFPTNSTSSIIGDVIPARTKARFWIRRSRQNESRGRRNITESSLCCWLISLLHLLLFTSFSVVYSCRTTTSLVSIVSNNNRCSGNTRRRPGEKWMSSTQVPIMTIYSFYHADATDSEGEKFWKLKWFENEQSKYLEKTRVEMQSYPLIFVPPHFAFTSFFLNLDLFFFFFKILRLFRFLSSLFQFKAFLL